MKGMKYILILPFVNIGIVGCNSSIPIQNDNAQAVTKKIEQQKAEENKNIVSEVIIVFKEGITVQEAKDIIDTYGMQVLKVYESISISTRKPMLHVGSSLPMKETIQLLRKDPQIFSISPNYVRQLK
jgi:ERCC4-related helicase